jgi:hypothetical protein
MSNLDELRLFPTENYDDLMGQLISGYGDDSMMHLTQVLNWWFLDQGHNQAAIAMERLTRHAEVQAEKRRATEKELSDAKQEIAQNLHKIVELTREVNMLLKVVRGALTP